MFSVLSAFQIQRKGGSFLVGGRLVVPFSLRNSDQRRLPENLLLLSRLVSAVSDLVNFLLPFEVHERGFFVRGCVLKIPAKSDRMYQEVVTMVYYNCLSLCNACKISCKDPELCFYLLVEWMHRNSNNQALEAMSLNLNVSFLRLKIMLFPKKEIF